MMILLQIWLRQIQSDGKRKTILSPIRQYAQANNELYWFTKKEKHTSKARKTSQPIKIRELRFAAKTSLNLLLGKLEHVAKGKKKLSPKIIRASSPMWES